MAKKETVVLAVADWRLDAYDPSIEDVVTITRAGTEVPADKEQEVRNQARKSGVSIRKVS